MALTRAQIRPWCLLVLVALSVTGLVWHFSWKTALGQVSIRGEADLSQSADRLIAQLQSFRELAVILADHPEVETLLRPTFRRLDDMAAQAAQERGAHLLLEMADRSGALRIAAFDLNGRMVAASEEANGDELARLWAPALARAGQAALGRFIGVDSVSGRRSFGIAAPVFGDPYLPPTGALVVAVDLEGIEAEWRAGPTAVFFAEDTGRIMATNRNELLIDADRPPQFEDVTMRSLNGYELWRIAQSGPYIPALALHLSRDLPVIEMRGDALVDVAPAARLVWLQTILAAMACLSVGSFAIWLSSRRAALARQLASEAAANQALEMRVTERTRELSVTNAALRREVSERKEAEAQLKAAQDRLVQAGKLSALGEMSAGISHELNQPLMAIQSFAENAELLLERGRLEVVAQNLSRISQLGHRMGRIIRNLRAFARQENAPVRPIDPVPVIDAALEMVESRLRRGPVPLDWHPPAMPVRVMAGEVRLQQVVMNLISNALDAMEESPAASLSIRVEPGLRDVHIVVADTGPGIANADRIFDPFYSTKEVGVSEGMGLGLSISYGLVQSFGGAIEGRNRDSGGAVFTVTLPRPAEDLAA